MSSPISRLAKPPKGGWRGNKSGQEATPKLIRLDASDLKLIERAAKAANTSSSYFIVQAAVAKARQVLA
jgi:uncharacterized protein (DUF1778 family)